ncbi:ribosome maturation factor RimP [Prochlorothrix hollandica]|uniref:Ribosome maturation factor RimP n=1 Tax=Prochlorothrix hollandica PCC 9006 = CALU 1027 TaxID=317619 RepID=A0A0M2PTP2_PROHO|nr:ribosome maturation factor RimP [Prochlorothrix hollandica]KKI98038.1 ribosome maturation protein RimP [Prochlorothrix hollandica PCC 9006 = CALU 1027]
MVHPLIPAILTLANPVATSLGLEIVQAVLQTNQSPPVLRIDIRHPSRDVVLEDCALMSRTLDEVLDGAEIIPSAYVLEVSSPGIPDDLTTDREFTSFKGFPIAVHLKASAKGTPQRQGLLVGRDDTHVHLNQKGRLIKILRSDVETVRLLDSDLEP